MSTRLPSRSLRRRASLAVVVVLPEPCRPTIRMGAGGESMRRWPGSPSPRSMSMSASWTILTTCWPGVTDLVTAWPLAWSATFWTKCAGDRQRDVGLEQRGADLAQRGGDVLVGEGALAGERAEDAGEPVGKGLEHGPPPSSNDDRAGGRDALTGGDPEGQDRRVRDSPGTWRRSRGEGGGGSSPGGPRRRRGRRVQNCLTPVERAPVRAAREARGNGLQEKRVITAGCGKGAMHNPCTTCAQRVCQVNGVGARTCARVWLGGRVRSFPRRGSARASGGGRGGRRWTPACRGSAAPASGWTSGRRS